MYLCIIHYWLCFFQYIGCVDFVSHCNTKYSLHFQKYHKKENITRNTTFSKYKITYIEDKFQTLLINFYLAQIFFFLFSCFSDFVSQRKGFENLCKDSCHKRRVHVYRWYVYFIHIYSKQFINSLNIQWAKQTCSATETHFIHVNTFTTYSVMTFHRYKCTNSK